MGKFFKILAGIILLLFVAVVVGGYIFIKTFNFNDYKDDVTELVSEKLGRKLVINGEAYVGLSLFPTIIVEDVELANAAWAKEPMMVKVKRFEIQFALMPLLKKQIEIRNISLIEPQVNLEVAKNGQQNWIFDLHKQAENTVGKKISLSLISDANAATDVEDSSFTLANLAAQNVEISNGILTYNDKGKITNLKISNVAVSIPSIDENISLSFVLELDGAPIEGKATVGSINNFLHKPEAYPVILNLKAYGVKTSLDGIVSNPTANINYTFKANIYNPAGNFDLPETTLEAIVKGNLQKIGADISLLNIVNNKITGVVEANISKKVPYVVANLKASVFDLRVFNKNSPMAYVVPELISSAQATEMVPATPIPYASLGAVNADIKLVIGKLILNEALQADNVNLTLKLKDSVLSISPFNMNFGGGDVSGSLALSAPAKKAELKFVGKDLLLQKLHQEFQVSGDGDFGVAEGGNLDFDVNLQSGGDTLRSVVTNLKGQVAAVVGKTEMQTGKLKFLTSTFAKQLLEVLGIREDTSKKIDVACLAVHGDFADGKVSFPHGVALESKQMYIVSDGKINLQNDKIDFSIKPNIKDVSIVQALSSFIKVKGTLQDPKLALDNTSTAKAIIGVAATGGTAYLGSQFMSSDSAPCYTALKGTVYANRFAAPSGVVNGAKGIYQGAEKTVSAGVKNLKDTAKGVLNMFKNSLKSNKSETTSGAQ